MADFRVIYTAGGIDQVVNNSTVADITAAMTSRFSELAGVSPVVDGETITFVVRTGSKAASYRVVYTAGGVDQVVTGSTVADITAAMTSRFSELAGVSPVVDGETVTFAVRTGSKAV